MVDQAISVSYEKAHPGLHDKPIFFENQFIAFYEDGTVQDIIRRGYTDKSKEEEAQNIKNLRKNMEVLKRYPKELTYSIQANGTLIRKKQDEIVSADLCNWVTQEHAFPSGKTAYPGDMVIGVLDTTSESGALRVVAEQLFRRVQEKP